MVRDNFQFNGMDSIIYDGEMSKVQALVNSDYGVVYGYHFSFYSDISSVLSFKTAINYTKGFDGNSNPLRHVSPLFGGTHFILTYEKLKLDFYAIYNGQISYSNLATSERDKPHIYATDSDGNPYSPAWYTINLKTTYQINPTFRINTGIENIFNVRYRPYSSGIVAPGINLFIAVRVNV